MYEAMKDLDTTSSIDRGDPNDDPDTFDVQAMESQPTTTTEM